MDIGIVAKYFFEAGIFVCLIILLFGQKKINRFHIGKDGIDVHGAQCASELQEKHEKLFASITGAIEADIKKREAKYADFDSMIRDTALQACIAIMYNKDAPVLERFNAAIVYFRYHGNGNGQEQVVKIITQDKQNAVIWKSALSEDMKRNGPSDDRYFLEAIGIINKQIA